MAEMTLLEGSHDSHGYFIYTFPKAPIGFLSWISSDNKYYLVQRSNDGCWTLFRKKFSPLTLTPVKSTPVDSNNVIVALNFRLWYCALRSSKS